MPAKVYTDKDADLAHLNGKVCAVIGFGSQGHAHALNLKDSGVQVIVGLYKGSKSVPVAEEHGFEVLEVADVVPVEDAIGLVTAELPRHLLGDAGTTEITYSTSAQVVE